MTRTTCRRAAKRHYCERCRYPIQPGTMYLEHVCSPGHDDLGNTGWWRLAECETCAVACGRAHLFDARVPV